jgi:hypothetical protein
MVLLDCFRQKQTAKKSIYFKKFYGNCRRTTAVEQLPSHNTTLFNIKQIWTVFVRNEQQKI